MNSLRTILAATLGLAACSAAPPQMPYPAFIQAGDLPNVFLAGLPGVDAKQLAGNPRTRRSSNQVILPAEWSFTTSASPGKSVEIYVLQGEIQLGDLMLGPGGYAYLPSGTFGTSMSTDVGAEILYFLDDLDPKAVIQTPLILSADIIDWAPVSGDDEDLGLLVKELRKDPGNGSRTWLLSVSPTATRRWARSTVLREGFLVSGSDRLSECLDGEPVTGDYLAGGYFLRPPGAVSGGPESISETGATWLLREARTGRVEYLDACPTSDGG
ncbi:MAG: hypothetical protein KJO31_10330 [Gammaproteobacteria bacterium]|nr:hypothetical protein [Gammaproteobacteria bacterium]